MKAYPLLSSWNKSTYWTGFISIEGCLIRVALKAPNFPTIQGATFEGDKDARKMCGQFDDKIEDLIESGCTVLKFLGSFVELVKSTWVSQEKAKGGHSIQPQFYSNLLNELDQIGLENIVFVSKDYREIHVKHFDPSGRRHVIKYSLPQKYPNVPLDVTVELPVPALHENFIWPSKLFEANNFFFSQLKLLDQFWSEMEDFDRNSTVIDPPNPNHSHNHRRILLEDRIIVHLVVDPLKPRGFPEINISGPHRIVSEMDVRVEKQCKNWNEGQSVIENLEALLDQSCRPANSDDGIACDMEFICTVCYMYSFEGEIPDRNCDCGANYHNKCLSDLYANDFLTNIKKCVECPGCGSDIKLLY